jgi:membrane fusion protein (multidrug efflux system)
MKQLPETPMTATADSPPTAATNPRRRRIALLLASAVFLTLGAAYGGYWALSARYLESTDDAYVAGNIVQVTPQVAGTVVAIAADDTDFIKAGDRLVMLDPADSKVALDQAEAALAQTVRSVRSVYATNATLAANVALQDSELAKVQADLHRRRNLARTGAIAYEELNHAETAVKVAQADLLAAKEKLATNRAFTDGIEVDHHPQVRLAAAKLREAYLAYQRSTVPASVSGHIAKRAVQLGQHVAPGTPLMAIVPLDQLWIDANFKEGQLARMRIGQPVRLEADLYGGEVVYHGTIVGLAAGTGSAFSLLPPQNATGNWIKVVQRLPVRVALDPAELKRRPLRIGLSMTATVDVRDQSGAQLATATRPQHAYQTAVFDGQTAAAEQRVQHIIAANDGSTAMAARGDDESAANALHLVHSPRR